MPPRKKRPIKKKTTEQVEKVLNEVLRRRFLDNLTKPTSQDSGATEAVVGKCQVLYVSAPTGCGGDIICFTQRVYRGDPMQRIIGPGCHNQMSTVSEIYCKRCGIKFEFLPEFMKT